MGCGTSCSRTSRRRRRRARRSSFAPWQCRVFRLSSRGMTEQVAMRVWPGTPYPLGAIVGRRGRQLRPLLGARDGGPAAACSTIRDVGTAVDRHRADGDDRPGLARLPARRAARRPLRLQGRRSLRAEPGIASIPTSSSSTPTPRRSAARSTGATTCSATRSAIRRRGPLLRPPRLRQRHAQVPSSSTPPSPGRTIGRPARRGTARSSTRHTCGA